MYAPTAHEYDYINEDISVSDLKRIRCAARVAIDSDHHRFRFGAVAVKSGRYLSAGNNVAKSSPLVPPDRMSIHAEVQTLKGLPTAWGVTLYVVRLDAFGKMTLAKPCLHCFDYMREVGVSRVVFSVDPSTVHSYRLDMISI